MTSFSEFGLSEPIIRALAQENYQTPTPIQKDALPLVLAGRDLVGIAQTGTGKTAAFALPILNRLAATPRAPDKKSCRVLVLSPTRELSGQILDSFRTYGKYMRLSSTLAIGGVSMGKQVRALTGGVDVLVATPGRLLDLVAAMRCDLARSRCWCSTKPTACSTWASSTTSARSSPSCRASGRRCCSPPPCRARSPSWPQTMLRNPARVAVTPAATTVDRIDAAGHPSSIAPPSPRSWSKLLQAEPVERVLVFTRTKHGADKVVRGLDKSGIAAAAHPRQQVAEPARARAGGFPQRKIRTLVATDIAARGIDVDGIST